MTPPTEKHIAAAIEILDERFIALLGVDRLGACVQIVAQALDKADREGMKRAEAICYARSKEHHKQSKQYEADGDEGSQVQCLTESVEAMYCAAAIRAEAGEE